MAQRFDAKTFITDANVADQSDSGSLPDSIENYLQWGRTNDAIVAISSCKLSGDRIFTIVIHDNDYLSGGG
tara:strand:+ start:296 stop:508 length:213 start_codon:yes stop_codon:yes gene_type:complete